MMKKFFIELPNSNAKKWLKIKENLLFIHDFKTLKKYYSFPLHVINGLDSQEVKYFIEKMVPEMISNVMMIMDGSFSDGKIVADDANVVLDSRQVFCLVSMMFLDVINEHNSGNIKFRKILESNSDTSVTIFRGMLSYFNEMIKNKNDVYKVQFMKRHVNDYPNYRTSNKKICKVRLSSKKMEESFDECTAKVIFSNERIGGLFFSSALLQEETFFTLKPELLVGMYLCPRIQEKETLIIKGAKQFSILSGYAYIYIKICKELLCK